MIRHLIPKMLHAWIFIVCVFSANAFIEDQLEKDRDLLDEYGNRNDENIIGHGNNNNEYIQFDESVIVSEDHAPDDRHNTNKDGSAFSMSRIKHAIIIDEIISEPTTGNKNDYYIDVHIRMKEFLDKHERRFKNKHGNNSSGDRATLKSSNRPIGVDPVNARDAKISENDKSSHKSERNERHGSERISHYVHVYENENSNSDATGLRSKIVGHRTGENVRHRHNKESAINKVNPNSDDTANEDHFIIETKETAHEKNRHIEYHDRNHRNTSIHDNKTMAKINGDTNGTHRHVDDTDHRHSTKTDSDTIVGNQVSSTPEYRDITKTVQVRHRGHKHKHSVTRKRKHRPHRGTKTSQQNIISHAIHVELATALPNTQNRESEQETINFARNIAEMSENNLSNCLCSSLCPLIILFFLALSLRF